MHGHIARAGISSKEIFIHKNNAQNLEREQNIYAQKIERVHGSLKWRRKVIHPSRS